MARGASVGKIVEQLQDTSTRGVLVVGLPGTGKTWLLGQVLTALGAGSVVIRLSPSNALSTVPFGAVNARMRANLVRSSDYYEVLNGLLDEIRAGFDAAGTVVLMVDNSEFLDGHSAAVITQAIMSTDAKLVLVDRLASQHSHLRELWRDGHLSRFEMESLKSTDVRVFLEDVLGSKVSSAAAHYLWTRSAGHPLALKGMVSGALEEGSLQQIDGVWMLDHPGDTLGSESQALLRMDLDQLNPASRRAMEILALAGPLPLDVVLELAGAESVDDLQTRNLVSMVSGDTLSLWLSRPVTAAPIRRMVQFGRSRRLLEEVLTVFPLSEDWAPERLISFTRWATDCGVPVPDGQLLAAATWANRLFRVNDALLLTSIPVKEGYRAAFWAQRSVAELNQNHIHQARSLALRSLADADSPEVGACALQALHLAFAADRDHKSYFSAALHHYQEKFGPVSLTAHSTRADLDVLTLLAMAELTWGEDISAVDRIYTLLAHPLAANRVDQTLLKSLLCEVHTAMGQMVSATALADDVMAEVESPHGFPRPDIALLAYARSVLAYISSGNWAVADKALAPQLFPNPDVLLIGGGMRELATATMHLRRGHIDDALNVLGPAVGLLSVYDPWLMLPGARGALAYCLAIRGDTHAAQIPLEHLRTAPFQGHSYYHVEGAAYAAAARVLVGQEQEGLGELHALLRTCQKLGHTGTELTVLTLLILAGQHQHLPRLAEVAGLLDSPTKVVFQQWAAALTTADPAMMAHASTVAAEFGFVLIARELAAGAQTLLHDDSPFPVRVDTTRTTGSVPEFLSPQSQVLAPDGRPRMTRREHEIATLVAQGKSNSAVATHLNLSLRTIEGHLYRTFIKLGLQSREQLAEVLAEDLAPARLLN